MGTDNSHNVVADQKYRPSDIAPILPEYLTSSVDWQRLTEFEPSEELMEQITDSRLSLIQNLLGCERLVTPPEPLVRLYEEMLYRIDISHKDNRQKQANAKKQAEVLTKRDMEAVRTAIDMARGVPLNSR